MSIVKFILKEWVSEGNYNETLLGTYKMPESPIIGDDITMTDASTKTNRRYIVSGKNWDMQKNEILVFLTRI